MKTRFNYKEMGRKTDTLKTFIGGKVYYDDLGQQILTHHENDTVQLILDVRGWGAIQNLFMKDGTFVKHGYKEAEKLQKELGEWVADAINQKIKRDGLEGK